MNVRLSVMTNYTHLCKEQRDTIQYLLDRNYTFIQIGNAIGKDRTTISKEIKRNRYLKSFTNNDAFDSKAISEAVNACPNLSKYPYVCNFCKNKGGCRKNKLYYHSNIAQQHYENTLKTSREGVDIIPEIVEEIEQSIIPLIKEKKQSVNQVYINHSDVLYFTKPTFYKYINIGVLSLSNLDLPKKVKYKKRKHNKSNENKRKLAILKGRKYEDYLSFVSKHPKMNICQMDTVEGNKGSRKVLLTIIDVETHFMFIRLLNQKDIKSVNNAWDNFKHNLNSKQYSKLFKIVLTDNGSEFLDPLHIEYDYNTGRKLSYVFYCKPYSSWQKGCIEKNHEYIRKIFPKGTNFDNFTDEQIQKLEDIINNIPRDSLKGNSPYNLFTKKYPDILEVFNISYISPDDVTLTKESVLGDK